MPAAVYMRFDERKWASTLVKVYRHMRLLERSKYLEPFFSQFISPLVKYVASKHKLGSTPLSNISAAQPTPNKLLNHGPVVGGMDVVYEEDDQDPLLINRGTTPNKKKTAIRSRHDATGSIDRANSNESRKSKKGSRSSHGSRNNREYQQPQISSRSKVKQELIKGSQSI